jgi:Flp pilus assembly protein TadG
MRTLRRLIADRQGAAAVEFAVIAPFLGAVVLGLMVAWEPATAMLRMRAAVHAGASYVRNGGSDDTRTYTVVEEAWERKPADAGISVTRACLCGTTAQPCTLACTDSTPPSVYVTIAAESTDDSRAFGKTQARSEVVRVR